METQRSGYSFAMKFVSHFAEPCHTHIFMVKILLDQVERQGQFHVFHIILLFVSFPLFGSPREERDDSVSIPSAPMVSEPFGDSLVKKALFPLLGATPGKFSKFLASCITVTDVNALDELIPCLYYIGNEDQVEAFMRYSWSYLDSFLIVVGHLILGQTNLG